jgi:cobalt/nickel transport protein
MKTKPFLTAGLLVALVLAGIVSFYASGAPDGLEKVAADKGLGAEEPEHALGDSPLGDYGVRGVENERLSGGLAGVIGVGVTLAVGGGLFWAVRRRTAQEAAQETAQETAGETAGEPGTSSRR